MLADGGAVASAAHQAAMASLMVVPSMVSLTKRGEKVETWVTQEERKAPHPGRVGAPLAVHCAMNSWP